MKLVLLYEEVYSYSYAVINKLENNYNHEVHLIHWGKNKFAKMHNDFYSPSYKVDLRGNRFFILLKKVRNINPDVIVIPGWNDKAYLAVALWARLKNIPVVCTLDTQYTASFKQVLARYLGFSFLKNIFYSHVWIPGHPQFYTSIMLGFKRNQIIYDLLSADSDIFQRISLPEKKIQTDKQINFLFVGRLEEEKGVGALISAWKKLSNANDQWSLTIVGSGSLIDDFIGLKNVACKGYLDPYEVSLLMRSMDCFILPSYNEPWGLVIHEAALSGLPIICTINCGASSSFVIDEYNGFLVNKGDVESLILAMNSYANLTSQDKVKYSQRSMELGGRVTSSTSAAQFNSMLLSLDV